MTSYIKGYYSKSIYQNATGYNIGLFKVSDTNDESLADYIGRTITFTGYFHELNNIDTYIFYGKKVEHEKYGEQFQVDSYDRCKPEEKDSIIEFLTSGLFKGIGEKKAKSIVDVLGKDTLKIILENPDNLPNATPLPSARTFATLTAPNTFLSPVEFILAPYESLIIADVIYVF